MRRFLKEFFSFTPSEMRIIIILSGLILISFLLRWFVPVNDFQKFILTDEDQITIDSFIKSLEKISYEKEMVYSPEEELTAPPVYRIFDPNTVDSEEMDEMGFPGFIRKNILKYRQSGGRFIDKTDVRKIYGFTDSIYNLWENYIVIPVTINKVSEPGKTDEMKNVTAELNSADSSELLEIHGIGPYFAGKIVDYRERLGGFLNIMQLLEINGMDSLKIEIIKPQLVLDTLLIEKIDINMADIEELKRHPYISARLAKAIVKYREFSGRIDDMNELLKNRVICERELTRLAPYIIISPMIFTKPPAQAGSDQNLQEP